MPKKNRLINSCACFRWQESSHQNSGSDTWHRGGRAQWIPHTEKTVQPPQPARSLRGLSQEITIPLTTWQVVVRHGGIVPLHRILHITAHLCRPIVESRVLLLSSFMSKSGSLRQSRFVICFQDTKIKFYLKCTLQNNQKCSSSTFMGALLHYVLR